MRNGALLNTSIGEYRLVDFLGAGGMGEVYRAVHMRLGRVVAVKVLTQAHRTPRLMERFYNEAQIQARLNHPRIATLFDFIEANATPCIVMEFINGQTLDEYISSMGALPVEDALRIFYALVEAIAYIHENGIVHRDIKANNIKITSTGEVKVLDFGIAKAVSSPQLTAMGDVIGTLQYLSPEQIKGGVADERSDIWALGVLLYEMVSGQVPFAAQTLGRLCEQISKVDYQAASTFNPSLPKEVEAVISRCLRKNPAARYQSTREILQDLVRLNENYPTVVLERETKPEIHWLDWSRQNWRVLSIYAATLLVILSALFWVIRNDSTPDPNAPTQPAAGVVNVNRQSAPARLEEPRKTVRINTLEGRAEVFQNGQLVGSTPFEIQAALGEQVKVVLKREGYKDERVEFAVTENKKDYTITLNPLKRPE
jgi:eukaryotic-like serine/threonine-protein kinase